jgi:hypothetical protein
VKVLGDMQESIQVNKICLLSEQEPWSHSKRCANGCYLDLSPLPAIPATIRAIPGYIKAVGRLVSSEIKPVMVGPRK